MSEKMAMEWKMILALGCDEVIPLEEVEGWSDFVEHAGSTGEVERVLREACGTEAGVYEVEISIEYTTDYYGEVDSDFYHSCKPLFLLNESSDTREITKETK